MDEYRAGRLNGLFGAMADPTRRAILARLALGEARVTELAKAFPISLNSTSKHIHKLERACLVRRNVVGRDHFLSLSAAPLAEAAAWIDEYRRFWEGSLNVLEAYVARKRKATPRKGR